MCLYPKLIKNRKYVSNKKNGGNIPTPSDPRLLMVPVGCGKCIECMKQKARAWQARLTEEIQQTNHGQFVTLTFSTESLIKLQKEIQGIDGYNLDNEIATLAVRRFLERWRKKHKVSVRHWLITELGQNNTEHLHLHGIIWTEKKQEIIDRWEYGHVFIGSYVNEQTVNYIVKYVHKTDQIHKEYTPKILTSKGIGAGYLKKINAKKNKYQGKNTDERYTTRTGLRINLPVYYRNGIYTEEEKEKLWLAKLDKEERWVCGEKVSVANGAEGYEALVKYYRAKNKWLGYGDDSKNWDRINYENARRKLAMQTRIQKDMALRQAETARRPGYPLQRDVSATIPNALTQENKDINK